MIQNEYDDEIDFTVRNDKYRGILVEKFDTANNAYFFKNQDQPIQRHCQQMQKIVVAANVKRSKKIRVDVSEFRYEYFQSNVATFKGCPLASVNEQIDKVCNLLVNKEVGAMKRSVTVAQNKDRKLEQKNARIAAKMEEADKYYQNLRARRLHEVFGSAGPEQQNHPPPPGDPKPPGDPNPLERGSTTPIPSEGHDAVAQSRAINVAVVSPRIDALPSGSGTQRHQGSASSMDFQLSDESF